MDKIDEGTDLKYKVSISGMGFDMSADEWRLEIRNQFGLLAATFEKRDCLVDGEGGWFFTLKKVKAGRYYVITTAFLPDDDYDDGVMALTDKQLLCKVGVRSLFPVAESRKIGLTVRFERVTDRSVPDVPHGEDEETIALKDVKILGTDDVNSAWRSSKDEE